ncbi:hypothetical protein NUW58_g8880 [Xylaria curta]|uniref:Uncharacterized protein n=1 Tax=Xylaria curta TaxID=42375 RepID=A0ACC1N5C5_9PEZI|nr:hypothetical protein NUW58_g8880 [Xylaria curta]
MAPTIDIPGYYYDSEKRRYFKIENSKTAPTNASWSSKNVLKRKLHEEDAAAAQRYFDLAKSRVTRARVLNDAVTGGFFAREYGAMKDDMQAACFAAGLVDKGHVPLVRGRNREMQVKHICAVGSDYKTGLCPVYAGTLPTSAVAC